MLQIRIEQVPALNSAAKREFVETTLAHVKRRFPLDCERIGESQMRKVICEGIVRSARHSITIRNDVREYIYLMIVLGSGFACDPQLPWATATLEDDAIPAEHRMALLKVKAVDYVERVAGRDGSGYVKALFRARSISFDDYSRAENTPEFLRRLWPQKMDTLSPADLESLLTLSDIRRLRYNLEERAGANVYAAQMFMLGSEFDRDPLYSWAEAILRNEISPDLKARSLHDEAMSQIDLALGLLRAKGEE